MRNCAPLIKHCAGGGQFPTAAKFEGERRKNNQKPRGANFASQESESRVFPGGAQLNIEKKNPKRIFCLLCDTSRNPDVLRNSKKRRGKKGLRGGQCPQKFFLFSSAQSHRSPSPKVQSCQNRISPSFKGSAKGVPLSGALSAFIK